MADLDHAQSAQDRLNALLSRDDPDLETCSHRLNILAIGVEAPKDDFPVPMTLYYWLPPTVRAITRVTVAPRLFSVMKECVSLGTFFVGDDLDLSEIFTRLLTERGESPESLTPQVLADLIAAGEVSVPTKGTFMRFFSFPVFSDDPSPSAVSGEGEFRVWKWVKRESIDVWTQQRNRPHNGILAPPSPP